MGANEMFLTMLGYTTEDLEAGRISWHKLTPPEFAHLDIRALEEIAERGYCEPLEKEFFHKEVHVRRASAETGFEDDMGGRSSALDLTERKKLEQHS